ncbi:unnamed protein product [Durusdinium trenchii]|uniref:Transposase MuDR plant domain-containing protein n=1 Tax=Durusdinium trenchii TaxID=1381693 RepID=A0ABP0HM67_9DINO
MEHSKIKTKDSEGNPTDKGLKALLETLKGAIAVVKLVKINELCGDDPKNRCGNTSFAEQDFRRLEEVGSGLSQQELVSVLRLVNNDYDFEKIANAMRIQFPQASGKPVHRRDLLACGRTPAARESSVGATSWARTDLESYGDAFEYYDDEAYMEDEDEEYEAPTFDGEAFWEDGGLEALAQDLHESEGNEEVAEALAIVMQFKKGKSKGQGTAQHRCQVLEVCRRLRKLWPERPALSPPKKKNDSKTTFFVLREGIESDDGKEINATFVPSNASFSENMQVSAGLWVRRSLHEDAPGNALDEPNDVEQKRVIAPTGSVSILPHYIDDERNYKDIGSAPGASFTMHVSPKPAREVLMVLKDTQVCEHGSYFGGIEREFHRGANGHTRHATCKDQDCNKTIIVAKRKDASQLWRYLVQIALRTKWGRQDLVSSSQMSARHETRHLPMMRSDEHSTRLSTTAMKMALEDQPIAPETYRFAFYLFDRAWSMVRITMELEAPGGLPLLLSRPFMEELQTVIDIGARTVSFNKIGVSGLPLVRTSRGHLEVSLLDFDMDSIQDQSPEHKSNDHDKSMAQDIAPRSPTQSELDYCIGPDMFHDYDGMNSGDYHDETMARELFLDEARAIRDAYERDLRGSESAAPAPGERGLICEDVNFIDDNPDQFIVISGSFKKVSTLPVYGKTWMKQLFAGQMGLSLLAIMDPYLTVITQACGFWWGNWSLFNLARGGHAAVTIMDLREANKPTLSLVNKITKDRIKAKRHTWVKQPECADILNFIEDSILLVLRVDGCQVGYKDAESGLLNKKPSLYVTTLLASVWPHTLNEMVLQAMVQQASAEATATYNTAEAFPSEVRPAEGPPGERESKRRRKKGRVAQLVGQYAAPPVYVRPDQPALALPDTNLPEEDQEAEPAVPPLDDASFRALQAAELDPILNITEGDRRRRWLTISLEIRKILRDLHVQFGHPTNSTLQRILRLPQSIQFDRGKEYLAFFSGYLNEFGVEREIVERAGALWKDVFYKTAHEMQLQGLEDVIRATTIVIQYRNSFPRPNGFSPDPHSWFTT